MIIVGLTGNIATGKSTVSAMLSRRGAFTIDADKHVHHLLCTDGAVQSQVETRFGPSVRFEDGAIDRSSLGAIVFQDAAAMRDLEAILHPRVQARVDELIVGSTSQIVVVEAIKLLESKLRERCQIIWVTSCREEQQVQRLMSGRVMTRAQALARVRSQSSQSEKRLHADWVIDTSGSIDHTEAQVERAWQELLGLEAR